MGRRIIPIPLWSGVPSLLPLEANKPKVYKLASEIWGVLLLGYSFAKETPRKNWPGSCHEDLFGGTIAGVKNLARVDKVY